MIKHYEDLQTDWGIARFYGDSILFRDKNLRITSKDIHKIKIRFFKIILIVADGQETVQIRFNKKLMGWLDPDYFLRLITYTVVSLAAFVLSFFKLDMTNPGICLFYAAFNGLLVFLFFNLLKKPLKESFFVISSLYGLLNIPLLLYLPLSSFFWSLFISIYAVYLVFVMFSRKSLLPGQIFLACLWILLSISAYNWFIAALKLSFDSKLELSLKQKVDYKMDGQKILWDQMSWGKPRFWKWDHLSFRESFFLGREIIFQLQPVRPVVLLHSPEKKRIGWLSFSKIRPQEFLGFVQAYLRNQKHLIWAKLLRNGPVVLVPKKHYGDARFIAYTQSYLFFDFSDQKETILHFLAAAPQKKGGQQSFIWCVRQDTEKSMEYVFHQILKGLTPVR